MSLPKKISPDRIKNAIVEFGVIYTQPYEVVLGFVLDKIIKNSNYQYVNSSSNIPLEIQELSGRNFLFFNEKIKFQLSPKTISINCYSNYISWSTYLPEIKKVIDLINEIESNIIINRIGLRYVSEYVNVDLEDCLKFEFTFGFPNIKSKHYSFNSEFQYKNALVILTLRNMMPTKVSNETQNLSHIDIDVIKKHLKIKLSDNDILIQNLEEIHKYEKEIFFDLLKNDFLKTLKPEY